MNSFSHINAKEQALAPVVPVSDGLLNRNCSCGKHTGGTGSCGKCNASERRSQAVRPADKPFDLSRVPVSQPVRNAESGEDIGERGAEPTGPERGSTLPYREAMELMRCIQLMGEDHAAECREQVLGEPAGPPSTAVNLTHTVTTPPTNDGCGGYTYAAQFQLNNATARTNGFIVQKLTFNLTRAQCDGTRDDFRKTYWEAWQVRNGTIFVGTSTSPHVADTFTVGPTPNEKGVNYEEGYAKFIPDYTEPLTWGRVPEARSLPATATSPPGWSDSGTLWRWVKNDFDCCDGHTRSDLTSQR